jgi:hypothetical protein
MTSGNSTTLWAAHREWASRPPDQRFQSMEALMAALSARRSMSRESTVDIGDLRCQSTPDGDLRLVNGEDMHPTNWSFSQFSRLISGVPDFFARLPPDMAAAIVNNRLTSVRREEREQLKLLRIAEDDRTIVQAFTSISYGRVFDAAVAEDAARFIERSGGMFRPPAAYKDGVFGAELVPSGLQTSDRDVWICLVDGGDRFDISPRAQLHRCVMLWNSEVGSKTLGMLTCWFNSICGNNIITGARDVREMRIRHTSGAPGRYLSEAVPQLMELGKTPPNVEAIRRAAAFPLRNLPGIGHHEQLDDVWIKSVAGQFAFTRAEVREAILVANREEGQCATLWDLVQGFTAAARQIPHADSRFDLERRSGALLNIAGE